LNSDEKFEKKLKNLKHIAVDEQTKVCPIAPLLGLYNLVPERGQGIQTNLF
jgi:hypothetical protein